MKKKLCTKCNLEKSIKLFDKRSGYDSLRSWCRECASASWNPQRKNISNRIRSGRRNAKERGYASPIVSIDQVIEAEETQKGLCASCSSSFGEPGYHLDHCHTTGMFRGLLCAACNLIEGLAVSPERCEAVAAYMRKFQCIQSVS